MTQTDVIKFLKLCVFVFTPISTENRCLKFYPVYLILIYSFWNSFCLYLRVVYYYPTFNASTVISDVACFITDWFFINIISIFGYCRREDYKIILKQIGKIEQKLYQLQISGIKEQCLFKIKLFFIATFSFWLVIQTYDNYYFFYLELRPDATFNYISLMAAKLYRLLLTFAVIGLCQYVENAYKTLALKLFTFSDKDNYPVRKEEIRKIDLIHFQLSKIFERFNDILGWSIFLYIQAVVIQLLYLLIYVINYTENYLPIIIFSYLCQEIVSIKT